MILSVLSFLFTLYAIAVCIDEKKDAHHVLSSYIAGALLITSFFVDDVDLQIWFKALAQNM